METIFGLEGVQERVRAAGGCVLTWGIFDGVHRGHQALVADLVAWGRSLRVPSVILTFMDHPDVILHHAPSSTLVPLRERLRLLGALGPDMALVLRFDGQFASQEPEEFVRDTVHTRLQARGIVYGFNAVFGRGRRGHYGLLEREAAPLGIRVRKAPEVAVRGLPVSSTAVRQAVGAADFALAAELLGRPAAVYGTVVPGAGRGHKIGVPTANLHPHHDVHPPGGVYCGRAYWSPAGGDPADACRSRALINIGARPTFEPAGGSVIEAHLLDTHEELYGLPLCLTFQSRLREEKRFPSAEALKAQIAVDIRQGVERLGEFPDLPPPGWG